MIEHIKNSAEVSLLQEYEKRHIDIKDLKEIKPLRTPIEKVSLKRLGDKMYEDFVKELRKA
jgi:hypothetical protein